MAEHAQGVHPLDMGRINMSDALEIEYWCRELGCTEAALNDAVAKVGEHVAAVREQLRTTRAG